MCLLLALMLTTIGLATAAAPREGDLAILHDIAEFEGGFAQQQAFWCVPPQIAPNVPLMISYMY